MHITVRSYNRCLFWVRPVGLQLYSSTYCTKAPTPVEVNGAFDISSQCWATKKHNSMSQKEKWFRVRVPWACNGSRQQKACQWGLRAPPFGGNWVNGSVKLTDSGNNEAKRHYFMAEWAPLAWAADLQRGLLFRRGVWMETLKQKHQQSPTTFYTGPEIRVSNQPWCHMHLVLRENKDGGSGQNSNNSKLGWDRKWHSLRLRHMDDRGDFGN